ncbi:pyridoxal phosphate-dependent aminotransferase [Halobacteriovorax sp. JY17]|uniref:pyridoxal phosphate-dependent aminotransferase n=1 Tax=Halobacteriovorax sp. JY17 TaxID=2014617 RepID=UPI0025C4BFD2|nr:pyridoxal phosphate-dependent aminotransferase [Halobacteriovorax sp. JY17]
MENSKRVNSIEPSKSISLSAKIAELKKLGEDIIGLNVGEPDFATPAPIIQATIAALKDNETRYSLVQGLDQLREGIAYYLNKKYTLNANKDHILLGNGSKHILYLIFQTLLNDGDEVIIPSPYWVTFPESVKLAGGVPRFVETKKNFQLDLKTIEEAITKKTKAILINTPNNPTGAVYNAEDLQGVVDLAEKYDLKIISDEAYEILTYNKVKHVNISSLSEVAFQRTLTVQSFSKSFCMTGFRIGYLCAEKSFIDDVNKLQGHLSGNNCTFAQYGALEALRLDAGLIRILTKELETRMKLAHELFSEFFPIQKPDGAFYLFPDVSDLIKKLGLKGSEELSLYLLEKAKVAILPGIAFGMENHLRISFAQSREEIIEAHKRIKAIL